MTGLFANTLKLTRFMLRRERLIAAIWIIILVLFSAALAPGLDEMFPDDEARESILMMYDNEIMTAMMGPIYGDSTGAMYSAFMLLWYLIAVAVMNVFLAVRHTRADEEQGRAEVVRSLPVGRLANVNATMLTAVVINTILAVTTGLAMAVTNTPTMDFAGCMLYGAVSGAVGLVFAAVTLVFCQLSQSTSGAVGMSFLALGGFYMLRAAGDISAEWLSLISPLGLPLRTKIFSENNITPVIALIIIAAVISAAAYALNSMRDLGQGFIPAKLGAESAKKSLLSPFGLSYRLLRKMAVVWIIVMLCAGASYGVVIGDIGSSVANMPAYLEMVGLPPEVIESLSDEQMTELSEEYADMITEYFGVFVTGMMTLIALIPVLVAGMKLRSEEKGGRVEHIISRSVSRVKYMGGYVVIAFVMSFFMQLATAVGLYFSAENAERFMNGKNPFTLLGEGGLISAYFAYLPAMWVMLSVAVALVGLFPKAAGAVWGYYGVVCFLTLIGNFPNVPEVMSAISPMTHTPQLPLDEMNLTPLIVMTAIAAVLTAAGIIGYRRRDMA
jgi:ABC-2 type transport system permease protein